MSSDKNCFNINSVGFNSCFTFIDISKLEADKKNNLNYKNQTVWKGSQAFGYS